MLLSRLYIHPNSYGSFKALLSCYLLWGSFHGHCFHTCLPPPTPPSPVLPSQPWVCNRLKMCLSPALAWVLQEALLPRGP